MVRFGALIGIFKGGESRDTSVSLEWLSVCRATLRLPGSAPSASRARNEATLSLTQPRKLQASGAVGDTEASQGGLAIKLITSLRPKV